LIQTSDPTIIENPLILCIVEKFGFN